MLHRLRHIIIIMLKQFTGALQNKAHNNKVPISLQTVLTPGHDRKTLSLCFNLSRRKLRSRHASLTCTHSSHSALTRPAQASSAAPRAHRAPCCAAATDHEDQEVATSACLSGGVHIYLFARPFHVLLPASEPLKPWLQQQSKIIALLVCKTDLGWNSLAALSVSVSAWVAEEFEHASNHKPNYLLQLLYCMNYKLYVLCLAITFDCQGRVDLTHYFWEHAHCCVPETGPWKGSCKKDSRIWLKCPTSIFSMSL